MHKIVVLSFVAAVAGCSAHVPLEFGTTSGGDTSAGSGGAGATSSSAAGPSGPSGPGPAGSTGAGETASSGATTGSSGAGGSMLGGQCMGGMPPQDPRCYWEDVCPTAQLADLEQAFNGGNWLSTSLEMTKRRYPSANCIIDMYQNDVGNYVDSSSFEALAESLMTMVHEETHGFDYDHANGQQTFAYFVQCNMPAMVPWIEAFPRSEILPLVQGTATDLYDGTYLTGQQGTYGWTELLDEWNAYLDGMAAIGLVGDYCTQGISGTDGAVAFAYYVELYLKQARTQHPTDYDQIKNDPQTVAFLRQEWNRMHFFLSFADVYPTISIEEQAIEQNLYDPANQSELEQVLGIALTPTNCN